MLESNLLAILQTMPTPPANIVYTALLSLIVLLLAIIGWGVKAGYEDVREWRLSVDKILEDHGTRIAVLEGVRKRRR